MQRNTSGRQDAPSSARRSAVGETLRGLTRVSARWPRFTLAVVILASCASLGYSFFFLRFKTDRSELFDPTARLHKVWTDYTKTFHHAADVTVVVEAPTVPQIKAILEELGTRLNREPEHFSNVLYKYEAGPLQHKWLQYLRPEQLQSGLQRINDYSPVLRGEWGLIELDQLFARLGEQVETRLASVTPGNPPSELDMKRLFRHAEFLTTSLNRFIVNGNDFRTPWPSFVQLDPQTRGFTDEVSYFMSDRSTMGFLHVVPKADASEVTGQSTALERLREIDQEVADAHPGVRIGITGIPVLEGDEMRRSQIDLGYATLIAAAGCLGLLVIGFRGIRHPLLALVTLAASLTWGFGFATEMVGHLNIFSLAVAAILVGLGIDFSIVFLSRYLQLRREGWLLRPALMETTANVGTASMTAAATTALAFLCTLMTDFVGLAELGILTAAGIMLCALGSFFVLPALISLADRHVDASRLPRPFEGALLRRVIGRFPLVTFALSALIVVGFGSQIVKYERKHFSSRVRFDHNLLALQDAGMESVRLERRMFDESSHSLLFAVSVADSERDMRERHAKLAALPSVRHVESLAMRLPSGQSDQTRQLLGEYRSRLASLPEKVPALQNADPAAVGKAVEAFYVRAKRYAADESANRVAVAADAFLTKFEKLSLAQQTRMLNDFQYRMATDLLRHLQVLRYASSDERIEANDLPRELVNRYVTPPDASGNRKWLLQVYPREKVWDGAPLAKFVADLRSVDADVTGTPIQNYETSLRVKHSYETASFYAFAIVWIVLLVDFLGTEARWLTLLPPLLITVLAGVMLHARHVPVDPMLFGASYVVMTAAIAVVLDARNLRDALIAYIPALAGTLMLFGVMGFFGITLNPANLIVLPLVLGIGVNNGVHLLHDFRSQKGPYQVSGSVFNTVMLTAMTSIVGFGSMMIASHRGIFSLGLVLAVGVSCCLFVSLMLVTSLLSLISRRDGTTATSSGRSDSTGSKRSDGSQKKAA